MKHLMSFHKENGKIINKQYPDLFDVQWLLEESQWPYFHLSALDKQPFNGMYVEAENLINKFHSHSVDIHRTEIVTLLILQCTTIFNKNRIVG